MTDANIPTKAELERRYIQLLKRLQPYVNHLAFSQLLSAMNQHLYGVYTDRLLANAIQGASEHAGSSIRAIMSSTLRDGLMAKTDNDHALIDTEEVSRFAGLFAEFSQVWNDWYELEKQLGGWLAVKQAMEDFEADFSDESFAAVMS